MYFPVDLHMQQPPRGGIWVGITCDLSKSNYELSNFYYSDSIIFDNTIQVKYYIFYPTYIHDYVRIFKIKKSVFKYI
ncbi:hypothetical protein V1477_020829 [Vespula maculifrons]|uniref:Uncharacterized protein n=1 Tax=Vespula maculifrons TaxID=7453 RepID=A0ABD2AN15_VESMC